MSATRVDDTYGTKSFYYKCSVCSRSVTILQLSVLAQVIGVLGVFLFAGLGVLMLNNRSYTGNDRLLGLLVVFGTPVFLLYTFFKNRKDDSANPICDPRAE